MRRREFITLLGGATAWPLAARAQQAKLPVVGFLCAASAEGYAAQLATFQRGLREAGFVEGRNVAIEYRFADGHYERMPDLAADLVRHQVAVITAAAIPSALAAKEATTANPIVFEVGTDPVPLGLVANLKRPGANVTGVVNLAHMLVPKRIELMHELVPNAEPIAVLLNPDNPNTQFLMSDLHVAEKALGVRIEFVEARTASAIEAAFVSILERRAGALVIGADAFLLSKTDELAALATRYHVAASSEVRDFAAAGGLMAYETDILDAYRLAGNYTGRILRGEKPAELPVQQATKAKLIINLKSAKALGITVPITLLARADEVIE